MGKTTLVQQVVERVAAPTRFASADEPTLRGREWIEQQWEAARLATRAAGRRGAVLVLDEIQKIPGWSETVKRLWDDDTRARRPLKIVVLGSAPLLVARGLSESLAGRFEMLHVPHWPFTEMQGFLDRVQAEAQAARRRRWRSGRGVSRRAGRALGHLMRVPWLDRAGV